MHQIYGCTVDFSSVSDVSALHGLPCSGTVAATEAACMCHYNCMLLLMFSCCPRSNPPQAAHARASELNDHVQHCCSNAYMSCKTAPMHVSLLTDKVSVLAPLKRLCMHHAAQISREGVIGPFGHIRAECAVHCCAASTQVLVGYKFILAFHVETYMHNISLAGSCQHLVMRHVQLTCSCNAT